MSSEKIPQGAMNGARLPQRVPGHRLQWFGTLLPPVRNDAPEPTSKPRRGDAAAFIQASRRARAQQGGRPC